MNRVSILLLLSLLAACGSSTQDPSPFADKLQVPPYKALSDSIRKDPKQSEFFFRRAVLLNRNDQPAAALADFRQAWKLEKQERYALGVGNSLLLSQPDSAITFVQAALKELPESLSLQLLTARAYEAAGKPDQAIAACDQILAQAPDQVNALVLKAEILEKKNDTPALIESLQKAHMLLPGNLAIVEKLAYQYAENKDIRSLAMADTLIRYDSLKENPNPYYIKGNYFVNTGDTRKAIYWFDETIKHDHRYLNAYIEKGKILFDKKKFEDAAAVFKLANTVSPAFPDAWYWIGRCQQQAGQLQDARESYQKAYALDKSFTEAKDAAAKIGQ